MGGSNYQAQVVNVNNNFQRQQCYLSATISLAQWVDESVIIFDADQYVIYNNNRFGSMDDARSKDKVNVNSICRYLAGRGIYKDIHNIHTEIKNAYNDLVPKFRRARMTGGGVVDFRIIPVLEKMNLAGMVLIGCKRNDERRTEIRSGEGKCIQLRRHEDL